MVSRKYLHTFSLLNVDRVSLYSKWNYCNVISPYNRIYYIDEGEGELSCAGGTTRLEPGYLYIIPSFTLFNMNCSAHLGQYFVHFFEDSTDGISLFSNNRNVSKVAASDIDLQLLKRLLEINPGRGINRSDNPNIYEKNIFYKEYQELNNRQNMSVAIETQGILWQLTAKFLSPDVLRHHRTEAIPVKLAATLEYIQLNMQDELSVSSLASRINQNPDYFSRQFKLHTGARPVNYINEKRVERAQYLMGTTRMNYSEISLKVGFQDLSYFSKVFKKLTGMSPSEYRKQMYSIGFHS